MLFAFMFTADTILVTITGKNPVVIPLKVTLVLSLPKLTTIDAAAAESVSSPI